MLKWAFGVFAALNVWCLVSMACCWLADDWRGAFTSLLLAGLCDRVAMGAWRAMKEGV